MAFDLATLHFILQQGLYSLCNYVQARDAPNMLKSLPIIPSRTSQNLSL